MNQENQILKNGSIRVTDGIISSVEPTDQSDRHAAANHVIDADGKVVIPGLIDAHRHTDFALVQGLFSDLDGTELLKEAFALYHTAEPTLGESFFEAAWQLACLRQLTHGVPRTATRGSYFGRAVDIDTESPPMPAIETNALTKRYGTTIAVDELDLAIPAGSVYGFLGPNGAGKTTTMRMLTGLTTPTSGTGTVAGASITDRDTLRQHIGYLPEEPPLYEQATAYEQLEYVAGLRDLPHEETQNRIDRLLDRLDLSPEDAATRIADYSKGMRQKVAYIQAVIHDPDVAFLDEPTSGLDPRAARTIRELIKGLAEEGTTVFLSTHILPVVEAVADTVGILYDGKLVAEDSPERLTKRAETGETRTLEDAFLELTSADPAAAETPEATDG